MKLFRFSISVILVMLIVIPSTNAFGFLSPNPGDLDRVIIKSFEFSNEDWENDGEMFVERGGVSFFVKDRFGKGYSFKITESYNRDVFVSIQLGDNFIEPMSIGSIVSENGMFIAWTLTSNYLYMNFTLSARAVEEIKIGHFEAMRYQWDYNYRSKFRSFIHGSSVRFDVKNDNSTPNVAINISKNFDYYGKNITVSGRGVLVKYEVKHGFKYPVNENRAYPVWFEVRDINSSNLQLVVHFTKGVSGDFTVVLNPVFYDYVTAVGICDAFGWTEPVASL